MSRLRLGGNFDGLGKSASIFHRRVRWIFCANSCEEPKSPLIETNAGLFVALTVMATIAATGLQILHSKLRRNLIS